MSSLRFFTVLILIKACLILICRSDPVEGSRLLEEAFRDYDKRIRPNFGGSPIMVNVSMFILSIPEIDTSSMTFKLSFFIRQLWIDPRLSFNSRRNIDTINLDASTSERIWSPDTFFVNEISSVPHQVMSKNQFCRIAQNGSVLFSSRVTLTAIADMDSCLFPYDSQKLVLDLESYGSQEKDMKYNWIQEDISRAPLKTPGFRINQMHATDETLTTSTGSYSRLVLTIHAKREPLAYELGVTLPISILVLLCWGTLYIRQASYATIIAFFLVSLIALLNGLLILGSSIIGPSLIGSNPVFLTPLQVHALLSCGFGVLCLIVNISNERKASAQKTNESNESKSRTESTSENCKEDDLPYGANLEDNQCTTVTPTDIEQNRPKTIKNRLADCRTKLIGERCVRCSLLVTFLVMNVIYIGVFRLLV